MIRMARLFSVLGVLWMATALFVFATGEDLLVDEPTTTGPTPPTEGATTTGPTPPTEGATTTGPTAPTEGATTTGPTAPTEGTTASGPTPPTEGTTASGPTPPTEGTTASGPTPPTEGTTASGPTPPTEGTTVTGPTPPTEGTTVTGPTPPTEGTTVTGPTPPTEGTTATGETDKPETDKPPVTTKPSPCDSNPCGGGSTCEARADETFVCLCLPGDSYIVEANICQKAKVFPGQVNLKGLIFVPEMSNKASAEFKEASDKIIAAMDKAFESNPAYIGCVVVEIKQKQARMTRAAEVEATVDLSFTSDSDATGAIVEETITDCADCGLTFDATNLCERNSCEGDSTECTASDGSFSCVCKKGYIKSNYTERLCLACPSGQKAVDSESCDACTFGYSGFNCSESWQLALVIVAVVLGVLTLSFLVALIVMSVKSPKKKSNKKSREAEDVKPYVSHFSTKAPLGGNSVKNDFPSQTKASAGVPRIPRATTTLDNRSNMEMMPSNSRQNLISSNSWLNEDQDGGYSYSRANNSYAQNRPQSNLYGQNRAQYNPYAQSQGNSNPYYKD
ncbi:hypothetical protein OJAV_G00189180 [Oryzias javanicus]|uniref:EGF-like domain-containing protein n=1 Tax=Oryzias javanicus TaxID=123683 RepID=A0A3S2MHI4_ORYJA|nr:hypothetical protein OJAV_G00189180 [Oryzias javanicus]